mmetsp:Transcript_57984/g.165093  ORF Transcript_57984/g.165093 Transcript_57984/m.165093 type:complete len:357 (-) Transcript_57984:1683-2753(-)
MQAGKLYAAGKGACSQGRHLGEASQGALLPGQRRGPATSPLDGLGLHGPVDVLLVLIERLRPIIVAVHGVQLHLLRQILLLVIHLQRLPQPLFELVLVEPGEQETRGRAAVPRLVPQADDGVLETPCLVHDGQRAVLLGVHLGQPAGLVLRGHQQEVAAGHHPVLHLGVEADVAADAALEVLLRGADLPLVAPVALAHHDQLHPAVHAVARVGQQPGDDLVDQMYALLVAQAPAEADEARARVLVEAQLLLQCSLALWLPLLEALRREVDWNVRIRHGAPLVGDAVEYTLEPPLAALLPQGVVQAEPTHGCLDLPRVVRRHGQHAVGHLDACSEQVHAVAAVVTVLARELALGLLG